VTLLVTRSQTGSIAGALYHKL